MNLPPLQAEARLQRDIKATKTIVITIAGFFLCYVPAIIYGVWGHQKGTIADMWFGFFAWYSLYISSAVNPIVYYLRTNRFCSAFKQFLKDPFGSSDFKEKSTDRSKEEKQKGEDRSRKEDSKRNGYEDEHTVYNDGNQTRHEYSVQLKNDAMDLAIESLQVRSYLHETGESKEHGETREQSRSACKRKSCEKIEKRTREESEEVLGNVPSCRANEFRKQRSSRRNVSLLQIVPLDTTRQPSEVIRATDAHCAKNKIIIERSLKTRRNTVTTFQEFQRGPKAAWINEEKKLEGQEGDAKTELNSTTRKQNKEELPQEEENEYEKKKKQTKGEQQKKKDEEKRKEEDGQQTEEEQKNKKNDEQKKVEKQQKKKEEEQKKEEERGEEKEGKHRNKKKDEQKKEEEQNTQEEQKKKEKEQKKKEEEQKKKEEEQKKKEEEQKKNEEEQKKEEEDQKKKEEEQKKKEEEQK